MRGSESSTLIKTRKASFAVSAASRQKGAYAIEFAFVFIVFFLVLYGMITYGLIFAAQQSMNFAAESGARAGLQWALTPEARAANAMKEAKKHVGWVEQLAYMSDKREPDDRAGEQVPLKIAVCNGVPDAPLVGYNLDADDELCLLTDTKKLEIVIRYPYASAPLVPYLGPSTLLQAAVPDTLESRASVDLGIAMDHSS